jgi:hypothetical protein
VRLHAYRERAKVVDAREAQMHELFAAIVKRIATPKDPLPPDTPWFGVVVARVLTRLANAAVIALSIAAYLLWHH